MPGQATITLTLAPNSGQTKPFPFVLKKVMDIPPPNILDEGDDEIKKEKLCLVEHAESGSDAASGGGGGSTAAGGGAGGVSASLTPAIWEKTIPYDGENFHLEYMDLDEFLLENGIPISLEEELQRSLGQEQSSGGSSSAEGDAKESLSSTTPDAAKPAQPEATNPPEATVKEEKKKEEAQQVKEREKENEDDEDEEEEEEEEKEDDEDDAESVVDTIELKTVEEEEEDSPTKERVTPTPMDPEEIEVDVNFQPDPTDLVLSSVPGGALFNPRKHRFSEDELKPQPMIKKARKVFVPDEQKDDKYWCRRKKNNVAAKRSRDARRLKENQIAVRASFLERENAALRQEVAELRKDCGRCKNVIARYEAKYGPLTVLEAQDMDM